MFRYVMTALVAIGLSLSFAPQSHAQLRGLVRELAPELKLPDLMKGKPPVSTSIQDAVYEDPNRDGFDPGPANAMSNLPLDDSNRFVLAPGYYTMTAQSYCLKAGTYGPTSGDAYLYAPLMGSQEKAVEAILRNSVDHPDIDQRDIQVLLWAIIARAKFEDLNSRAKLAATRLLTSRQLASLNRNAIDVLTNRQVQSLVGGVPQPVAAVLRAEADMRRMLSTGASYGELERVAVLAGMAPLGEGSRTNVPSERWSRHPDGYWVRYDASGYSRTMVELYVPEDASGVKYDPAVSVAVPTNTSKQRLGQSARFHAQ
ncbi:hypothetical protein [Erythrobacter sp. JK5]|uniref:hypothetical protein n=1 Tax=Erythrobacter sp. JK5 TaxID=2829500 RepID=UPI001BA7A575|nr:hypothetical protein [Erythrobacter sp. JK5]QUL38537.1 hypothetical protein KDC96_03825 [Erythrobacter sp. JK5]